MKRRPTVDQRKRRLRQELSDGFRRGTCLLLDRDWLVKHDVTASECYALSLDVAEALTDVFGLKVPREESERCSKCGDTFPIHADGTRRCPIATAEMRARQQGGA